MRAEKSLDFVKGVSPRRAVAVPMLAWVVSCFVCVDGFHDAARAADFVRGDCNADGTPGAAAPDRCDISDPVFLLQSLFLGGPPPGCVAACDANDDDQVDLADAVFSLSFCFLGGRVPPAPFPDCGADPSGQRLDCEVFPPCESARAPCVAMSARGTGDCDAFFGYAYDGRRCFGISGCDCEGEDCGELYDSFEECERATANCAPRCVAMDARADGPCDAILGVAFDGTSCVDLSGCECVGEDCDLVYASVAECEAVHFDCLEPCEIPDARGEGACRLVLGYAWNGERCETISGCECVGEDCALLFDSIAECERANADCIPGPCDAQDATGVGPCERFFGYAFDGRSCVGISGCECEGADCAELFESPEECERAFRECLGDPCDPQDARGSGVCALALGVVWDGQACVGISGCECEGADCDELYDSVEACEREHRECPATPACRALDAAGVGPCDAVLGVTWDGGACVEISGCDCEGADCDQLYERIEDCRVDRAECLDPCRPMDVREVGSCEPIHGWYWNGTDCELLSGCECAGADCDRLYASPAECEAATADCPPVENR